MIRNPVLLLLAKLLLAAAPMLILFPISVIKTGSIIAIQRSALEYKVDRLISAARQQPDVIVAGDSRAEFNFVPATFQKETGLLSMNVGVGYGTLGETYDVLKQKGILGKNRLIVISVSSYEISDGYFDDQPDDWTVVAKTPFGLRKLGYFNTFIDSYALFYMDHFKSFLRMQKRDDTRTDKATFSNQGYVVNNATFKLPQSGIVSPNPWYKDVQVSGIKQEDFVNAIRQYGNDKDVVVLYVGPFAPSYWEAIAGTNASSTEANFVALIKDEIRPYPNLHLLDFHAAGFPGISDDQFADDVHMNQLGAAIFTVALTNALREKHLIK